MRLKTTENRIRWSRRVILTVLVSFLGLGNLAAQNITLKPSQVRRGDSNKSTVLFRSDDAATIRWEEAIDGLELKVGTIPGVYGLKTIRMRGSQASSFSPGIVGLPVGVYYGVLTDSGEETFTGIQIDASSDPDIHYSREFKFAVESDQTPRIIEPKGSISEQVPTFEWEAIPGVVSYALIISTTPFTIGEEGTTLTDIRGLNPVWIHFSTETSARYGESSQDNPLIQFDALPLVPGQTYHYTVLNAYSKTDPAFLSVSLGPIVSFSLVDRGALGKPVLTYPVSQERIADEDFLVFEWDDVDGSLSYDVSVFERMTDGSTSSDLQVFSANTPNSQLSVPAFEVFRKGEYRWFVIANDREGAASVSSFATFRYDTDMGDFTFETRSSTDGEELLGVIVRVVSTDAGYNPPNPFVNISSPSLSDSLVVGEYEFTASKEGFSDTMVSVSIEENSSANILIEMKPLPSRIVGQVVDPNDAPVSDVTVRFTNILSGETLETSTGSEGVFSGDLTNGTYTIFVFKSGFRSPPEITVSVAENQILTLPDPLVVVDDEVFLSGRVVNQDGIPVPQARILAVLGSTSFETVTDGNGEWDLKLSEGEWTISSSKQGFLGPLPVVRNLFAGDTFSNINFVLVQQASRIEGQVQGLRTLPDGRQEVFPLSHATIYAYPLAGEGVSTVTTDDGRFLMDLGTGAYTIFARKDGFERNGAIELILGANQTFRDVRFQLEELTSSLFGTVVDANGRGIEGAEVFSTNGASTVSSAGGSFSLSVSGGPQEISARFPGMTPAGALTVAPASNTQVQGVEFRLYPHAASISGRVRTATGVLAGVFMTANNGFESFSTVTEANGHYSFDLPAGQWDISAKTSRFRQPTNLAKTLRAGQRSEDVDIWMDPNFILMEGFISHSASNQAGLEIRYDDVDESLGLPLHLTTLTGENGYYSVFLGARTRYLMQISEEGFQSFNHSFTTDLPEINIDFDASLIPSEAVLTGLVREASGVPLSGASIEAKIGGVTAFTTVSNADGSFQLSVEEGSYDIQASAVGFLTSQVPVTLEAGQRIDDLSLSLESNEGSLIATVLNPFGGIPIPGAMLEMRGPVLRTGLTSEDGTVALGALPAGSYALDVKADGFLFVTRFIDVEAATTSRQTFILVPIFGSITGEVVSSLGNSPLAGVSLRLIGEGLDKYAVSDNQGRFSFENLPDGGYSIQPEAFGYRLTPPSTATISRTNRNVSLPRISMTRVTGRITGSVLDSNSSNPLSGVSITASSQNGTVSSRSTSDGSFELSGLEAGNWRIDAVLDGFRFQSGSVTVATGQTTSSSIGMQPNLAELSGRIRNINGEALPFDVSVEIVTSRERQQTFTTAEGEFAFDSLPGGETIVLKTLIQREGYLDVESLINLAPGSALMELGDIPVLVQSAEIGGTVEKGGARIQVIHAGSGATIDVVTSQSTGEYKVEDLAPGTYQLRPSLQGFTFAPPFREVTLVDLEVGSASFTATSNVGLVEILVVNRDGVPARDIAVRITSLDRSFDQVFTTDANGLVMPTVIPLGHRYRVEPIADAYQFLPVFREIDLTNQSAANVSFTLIETNSFIAGSTLDETGALIDGVRVVAQRSISEQYEVLSVDGLYLLGPLPAGTYDVSAQKSGFNDAFTVATVDQDATRFGVELVLKRQSVTLTGRVTKAGEPIEGILVKLSGPVSASVSSSADGTFQFSDVPVATTGESLAQISIEREGRPSLQQTISYSFLDVGQVLVLEEFILASGSITLSLTDGIQPLSDILISFRSESGRVVQAVSDGSGVVVTSDDLDEGDYLISLIGSSRLSPIEKERIIRVPDNQSNISANFTLPFLHTPPPTVRSDTGTPIRVSFDSGNNQGLETAVLNLRLPGQQDFLFIPLTLSGSQFNGILPAVGEGEFSYFIQIQDGARQTRFETEVITIVPVVAGRLQNLVLSPDPHENIIRTGEDYTLLLQIRDGLGEDLTSEVISAGTISWTASDGSISVNPVQIGDRLGVTIRADAAGEFVLGLRVVLGNEVLEHRSVFRATATQLQDIRISVSETRMRNNNGFLRLGLTGQAEDGTQILLGNSVSWSLSPASVADIDENGIIRTSNEQFIGPLTVIVTDGVTGQNDTVEVAAYAELDGIHDRSLTDLAGTFIDVSAESIPFRAEIGLSRPRQAQPHRFITGAGSTRGLTAGDHLVRFDLQSDRSLLGDSLAIPATITLPSDPSISLYEGVASVGYYDAEKAVWKALPSLSTGESTITSQAVKLGDYSIVTANRGLDIRHLAALPSPFSPDIAPLKIGYFLESSSSPATVDIDVINIRGELVRTILSGDLQWSGRYGSRSGLREITWDGLTNDGKKARNGRYIIRIEARDQSGTVAKSIPVVLIK